MMRVRLYLLFVCLKLLHEHRTKFPLDLSFKLLITVALLTWYSIAYPTFLN